MLRFAFTKQIVNHDISLLSLLSLTIQLLELLAELDDHLLQYEGAHLGAHVGGEDGDQHAVLHDEPTGYQSGLMNQRVKQKVSQGSVDIIPAVVVVKLLNISRNPNHVRFSQSRTKNSIENNQTDLEEDQPVEESLQLLGQSLQSFLLLFRHSKVLFIPHCRWNILPHSFGFFNIS